MTTPRKLPVVIVPETPIYDSLSKPKSLIGVESAEFNSQSGALSDLNREIPWYEKRNHSKIDQKIPLKCVVDSVVKPLSKVRDSAEDNSCNSSSILGKRSANNSNSDHLNDELDPLLLDFDDFDDLQPMRRKLKRKADLKTESVEIIDIEKLQEPKIESKQLLLKKRNPVIIDIESEDEAEVEQEEQDETVLQVIQVLNTIPSAGLANLLKCTQEQADSIKNSCPFTNLDSLTSLKEWRLVKKYLDIQNNFNNVNDVISECEIVGSEIKRILDCWAENKTCEYDIPTKQPAFVNPKMTLKSYQLLGVSWMLMLYEKQLGGILADEMGLGKTAQVVTFLGSLQQNSLLDLRALIVVPSSTLGNWEREISLWCPSLEQISYSGSAKERRMLQYDIMDSNVNVIITTYAMATGAPEDRRFLDLIVRFLRKLKCDVLILDEGHMIKNNGSNRSKHLSGFKIPFKLLITGTPIQNNLLELLNLLTFINPELFTDAFSEFTSIFNNQVESADDLEHTVAREKIARASKILQPFILRRKKDEVSRDLPAKTGIVEFIKPSTAQKSMVYDIMVRSKKEYLSTNKSDIIKTKLNNVVMQLRKAAGHELLFRTLYTDEQIGIIAKLLKRVDLF